MCIAKPWYYPCMGSLQTCQGTMRYKDCHINAYTSKIQRNTCMYRPIHASYMNVWVCMCMYEYIWVYMTLYMYESARIRTYTVLNITTNDVTQRIGHCVSSIRSSHLAVGVHHDIVPSRWNSSLPVMHQQFACWCTLCTLFTQCAHCALRQSISLRHVRYILGVFLVNTLEHGVNISRL